MLSGERMLSGVGGAGTSAPAGTPAPAPSAPLAAPLESLPSEADAAAAGGAEAWKVQPKAAVSGREHSAARSLSLIHI